MMAIGRGLWAGVRRVGAVGVLAAALLAAVAQEGRAEIGSYLLFDIDSGEVIASHKPSEVWYPASLTKLMTAYVTFQAVEAGEVALTSPVKISVAARQQPPSRMGFALGTVITVETALRIILTKSANDVSVALAEAVGGTQGGFIERMNKAAEALGMSVTRYDNPHGLPNRKQVTSARDTALLMMALFEEFPERADFFAMSGVRLGGKTLRNHNVLMRRFEGATGMKTGFICSSGFNLAASAKRGDTHLGAVVLGGLTSKERDERTAELLAKGFEALASGGFVRLDGFNDVTARLAHRPVSGRRAPRGTVAELAAEQRPAVDRRQDVCGASRPLTRYTNGTVASLAAFEAQLEPAARYAEQVKEREDRRAALHAAARVQPLPLMGEAVAEAGASASDALAYANVGQEGASEATGEGLAGVAIAAAAARGRGDALGAAERLAEPATSPQQAPSGSEGAAVSDEAAVATAADAERAGAAEASLAPQDWERHSGLPLPNPYVTAALRNPLGDPPQSLPLSYFTGARTIAPVPIAIGGADKSRPNPRSGPVVGGGAPPVPIPRPLAEGRFGTESDEQAMMEHTQDVRAAQPPADPN